jgi:hypothetical protein
MFLIRNFASSQEDRDTIVRAAEANGMKVAGTRKSDANSVRKNSFLTWINPYNIDEEEGYEVRKGGCMAIAMILTNRARTMFAHTMMNELFKEGDYNYCNAEDIQVGKYDKGGCYDYHHDGYGRFLTVLTYQNGIGGTYFPLANTSTCADDEFGIICEKDASALASNCLPGRDGIIFVGREGLESYTASSSVAVGSVVEINPGDAIAFYNYKADGRENWKSLHASLSVPEEKWIVTNWFRSDALTGPVASLFKDRLSERF